MRRVTRSNRSYVEVEAGTPVTGHSPSRSVDKYYKRIKDKLPANRNKIESLLLDRKMKCIGPIFKLDKEATIKNKQENTEKNNNTNEKILNWKGTCAACGKGDASYYCHGCHAYYHFGNQCPFFEKHAGGLKISIPNSDSVTYSKLDCYSYCHPMLFGNPEVFDSLEREPVKKKAKKKK